MKSKSNLTTAKMKKLQNETKELEQLKEEAEKILFNLKFSLEKLYIQIKEIDPTNFDLENTVKSPESKYNIRFVDFPSKSKKYNVIGKMTTKVNILFDCEITETPENIKNEIINDFNEWCEDSFGSDKILKLDLEVSPKEE